MMARGRLLRKLKRLRIRVDSFGLMFIFCRKEKCSRLYGCRHGVPMHSLDGNDLRPVD
jgi:hypothetical protein